MGGNDLTLGEDHVSTVQEGREGEVYVHWFPKLLLPSASTTQVDS